MSVKSSSHISSPSLFLLAGESRALLSYGRYYLKGMPTQGLPRGDGRPVLVLPGFGASDTATRPLRDGLTQLGYATYGWAQGTNWGMQRGRREALVARLQMLHKKYGKPVVLIGWSLGGVFARELARAYPDQVEQVFSLGSPISGNPEATNVSRVFRLFNPRRDRRAEHEAFFARVPAPPVPCTSLYCRADGIVAWPCCIEVEGANIENVEVAGTHAGLPCSPEVLQVIAGKLAATA